MEELSIWIIGGFIAFLFPVLTYAPMRWIARIFFKPLTESYVFLLALLSIIALGEGVARFTLVVTSPDFVFPKFDFIPVNIVYLGYFVLILGVVGWYMIGFLQTLYYMIHMGTHTHTLPRKVYLNMLFLTTGVQTVAFSVMIYSYLYRVNPHLLIPLVFGIVLYFGLLMRFMSTLRTEDEIELVAYLTKVKHLTYVEAAVIVVFVVSSHFLFRMSHGALTSIALTYSSYYLLSLILGGLQVAQLQFTRRQ